MKNKYEIEFYKTDDGKIPFLKWVEKIRDKSIKAQIAMRIRRMTQGNFGDWKPLQGTDGKICELREHKSPGYRIYYTQKDSKIIIILAGSNKKDQSKTILKAKDYLNDYILK